VAVNFKIYERDLGGVYMYRLYKRVREYGSKWLSTTSGDSDFILEVLRNNMDDPVLGEFDWKIEKEIE